MLESQASMKLKKHKQMQQRTPPLLAPLTPRLFEQVLHAWSGSRLISLFKEALFTVYWVTTEEVK